MERGTIKAAATGGACDRGGAVSEAEGKLCFLQLSQAIVEALDWPLQHLAAFGIVMSSAASGMPPHSKCHAQQSCEHGRMPCREPLAQRCNMPDSFAKRQPSSTCSHPQQLCRVQPLCHSTAASPHQSQLCSPAVAPAGDAATPKRQRAPSTIAQRPVLNVGAAPPLLRQPALLQPSTGQSGQAVRGCSSKGLTGLGCAPPPLSQACDQPLVQHILGCGVADHDEGGQAATPEALHINTGSLELQLFRNLRSIQQGPVGVRQLHAWMQGSPAHMGECAGPQPGPRPLCWQLCWRRWKVQSCSAGLLAACCSSRGGADCPGEDARLQLRCSAAQPDMHQVVP